MHRPLGKLQLRHANSLPDPRSDLSQTSYASLPDRVCEFQNALITLTYESFSKNILIMRIPHMTTQAMLGLTYTICPTLSLMTLFEVGWL